MKHLFRMASLIVLIVSAAFVTRPAFAQDSNNAANTITLTETYLNAAIAESMAASGTPGIFTIDLQPGQMVINFTGTDQRGNAYTLGLTLVPVVSNGDLTFDTVSFSLNGFTMSIDNANNPAIADTTSSVTDLLGDEVGSGTIESLTITDTDLTVFLTQTNPNDPTYNIVDNLWSLTFSETSLNALPWVVEPTDPAVASVRVDLQEGQAVIYAMLTDGVTEVAYLLTPTTVNDFINWKLVTQIGSGGGAGIGASFMSLWRAYSDALYSNSLMTDVVINDTEITMTWDISMEPPSTTSQDVVYTAEEMEVNAVLATYLTEEITAFTVDMQPGKVLMNAAGIDDTGVAYTASLVLVPEVSNGVLLWLPESLVINNFSIESQDVQNNDELLNNWTAGFDNNRKTAYVTSIEITDTSMAITVNYR